MALSVRTKWVAALLVALVRLQGPDLNRNERASGVQRTHPYVREAEAAILRRALRDKARLAKR